MRRWIGLWLALWAIASVPAAAECPLQQPETVELYGTDIPAGGLPAYLHYSKVRMPLVSAHRGGDMPCYPENAIETMAHTLTFGPSLLEVDVRRLKDGTFILMHDETLDRTTTGEGAVTDATYDYVAGLHLEDPEGHRTAFRVPTLDKVLAFAKEAKAILTLDIKPGVDIDEVVAHVRKADVANRVVLISYSLAQAKAFHRAAPDMMLSVSMDTMTEIAAVKTSGIDPRLVVAWTGLKQLPQDFYEAVHKEGWLAMIGTLGNPATSMDAEIARSGDNKRYLGLLEAGADIIATDRHAAVQSIIPRWGRLQIFRCFSYNATLGGASGQRAAEGEPHHDHSPSRLSR